jgi:2-oxoglutarate dehydrogenase E2 component (dihydrolipoamide succinyltransferase)
MMIEIKIPSPGESITIVKLSKWLVSDGEIVQKDTEVAEVESDKATLPLVALSSGKIIFKVAEGTDIRVGEVAALIDTSLALSLDSVSPTLQNRVAEKSEKIARVTISPLAKSMIEINKLNPDLLAAGKKKVRADDVRSAMATASSGGGLADQPLRKPMSSLRKKLSERLVAAKNETAMLTTFQEVDMSLVLNWKNSYQDQFQQKHGIKLGLMSFFTKAVVLAIRDFPDINSFVDGEDIISHPFVHIGIAVQTQKGLMVPVFHHAEKCSMAEIEKGIRNLADKARNNRISMNDLSGGTFTITNGGVFGSLFSTPILNPPQSGILGMHSIQERPVASGGLVVIRPMMFIALSYDHRIVDGRDSVGFLVKVKELVEDPARMAPGSQDPVKVLLEL